jgi:RNA polymerase sigma-70 factor, ECF subfamily
MDALIDQYGTRLHQTIGRLLAWSSDVDDVLQDVFLRAWQRFDSYRGDGSLEDWLVSLAFHRCRDHQRSMRRRLFHWLHYANRLPSPLLEEQLTHVTDTHAWNQMQQAMQQLASGDRELLVMIYIEQWPHQQLADHLKISVDVLHGRLHRARNRLKKHMQSS